VVLPLMAAAEENWIVEDSYLTAFSDLKTFVQYVQTIDKIATPEGKVDMHRPQARKLIDFLDETAVNGKMILLPKGTVIKVIKRFRKDNIKLQKGMRFWNVLKILPEGGSIPCYTDAPRDGQPERRISKTTKTQANPPIRHTVSEENAHAYTFAMLRQIDVHTKADGPEKTVPFFNAGLKSGAIISVPAGTEVGVRRILPPGFGLIEITGKEFWIQMEQLKKN